MESCKVGHVYKIMYVGNEDIKINYIGCTFNTIRDRFKCHIATYRNWLKKRSDKKFNPIYTYFEKYGTENFKMMLIQNYEVKDKDELLEHCQHWIEKMNCINK